MAKRFLFIFLPVTILLGGALDYLYELDIEKNRALLMAKEIEHVKFQSKVLASHLQNVISDFNIIADLHELKQLASAENGYDPLDLGGDFISISSRKGIYDQIRVLDLNGMEIVRVDYNNGNPVMTPKEKLQNKADRYYFKHTVNLGPRELFISPLELNIEHVKIEKPV